MEDLENLYKINKRIENQREHYANFTRKEQARGKAIDKQISLRLERIVLSIDELTYTRNNDLKIVYSRQNISARLAYRPKKKAVEDPLPSPDRTPISPMRSSTSSSSSISSVNANSITTASPSVLSRILRSNSDLNTQVALPPAPSHSPLKITRMIIGDNLTKFKMAPDYFEPDDEQVVLKNIVYPDDVIDKQPYDTVARYRTIIGESIDFSSKPLRIDVDSAETLVLVLEQFAQQFDGELNFSRKDLPFEYSTQHTVCGMADLGSTFMLLTDSILTAKFEFQMDNTDYHVLAQSRDIMENFALDFCAAICETLNCAPDYVRMFFVEQSDDEFKTVKVTFGLTTPVLKETETLAKDLQAQVQTGYTNNKVLEYVKKSEYECKWKTIIEYLNIQATDLDSRYNRDYRVPGLPKEESRGNESYYLPIGWFRHGLKVDNKYAGDIVWLGSVNAKGEWPVAFHGTNKDAVLGITNEGLLADKSASDAMKDQAVEKIGKEADRAGIYLATHCNDGADRYASSFSFTGLSRKADSFKVVFQCRAQPDKFTKHTEPVKMGQAWRFVDQNAIRPYGILLKAGDKQQTDDSEASTTDP